jgi:Zn-dependent M28 family amino/carboxypeptidase
MRTLLLALMVCSVPVLAPACAPAANGGQPTDVTNATARMEAVDSVRLIADIRTLAADSMEGRRTDTPGSARARAFLLRRFDEVGLEPVGGRFEREFRFTAPDGRAFRGVNLVGQVTGTVHPDRYIVVTAHYDGLGIRNGEIYNAADDNASGTAALLAFAERLRESRPRHSVVIAALDAEEGSVLGGRGLQGARAWVADPPVPLEHVVLNVNMDMISRNDRDELYAAGTYHTPALLPFVERVARDARLTLLTGHDRPDLPPGDDWTMSSDHGAFHEVGIPFVYFGVEDHPDYHRPTDTFENIQPGFFVRAAETVLRFVREVDAGLGGQRPGAAP